MYLNEIEQGSIHMELDALDARKLAVACYAAAGIRCPGNVTHELDHGDPFDWLVTMAAAFDAAALAAGYYGTLDVPDTEGYTLQGMRAGKLLEPLWHEGLKEAKS